MEIKGELKGIDTDTDIATIEIKVNMPKMVEVMSKVPHALVLGGKPYEIDWDWEYANFAEAIKNALPEILNSPTKTKNLPIPEKLLWCRCNSPSPALVMDKGKLVCRDCRLPVSNEKGRER